MSQKILSVFIDESGDFGEYDSRAPYYLVTMVTHDQRADLSDRITAFGQHMDFLGYERHAVHAGLLIRRESIYIHDRMETRKKLFNSLFHFVRLSDIHYDCIHIDKSVCTDMIAMTAEVSKALAAALRERADYWNQFDRLIIYYDNGQVELTRILTSVFYTLFSKVEFRKVQPKDYILFQAADLICTLELVAAKFEHHTASKSEMEFFISEREFRKNYWKHIVKKRILP